MLVKFPRAGRAPIAVVLGFCLSCGSPPGPSVPAEPSQEQKPVVEASESALQRGVAAIENQELEKALTELSTAVERKPQSAQAHYYLGVAQHGLGQLDAAAASFRESKRLAPQLLEASINLGAVLLDAGDAAAALQATDEALQRFAKQPELLYNRALALEALERPTDAADAYRVAVAAQPDASEVRFGYARALLAAREPKKARSQLLKLLAVEDAAVLASTARLLARLKDFQSCVRALNSALALQASAELHVERGLCKHALGLEEDALSDYRAAARIGPAFAPAHYYLGMHLRSSKHYAEARAALEKALELAGDNRLGEAARRALAEIPASP